MVRLVWLKISGKCSWLILWMKHQICNVLWAFNKRKAVLIALNFEFNITTLIIEFNEVWQSDQWQQWVTLETSNLLLHHWKAFLSRRRFLFVYFSLQIQSANTEVLAIFPFLLLKLQFPILLSWRANRASVLSSEIISNTFYLQNQRLLFALK